MCLLFLKEMALSNIKVRTKTVTVIGWNGVIMTMLILIAIGVGVSIPNLLAQKQYSQEKK